MKLFKILLLPALLTVVFAPGSAFADDNEYAPEINSVRDREVAFRAVMNRKYIAVNRLRLSWERIGQAMQSLNHDLNQRPQNTLSLGIPDSPAARQIALLISEKAKAETALLHLTLAENLVNSEARMADIDLSSGEFGPDSNLTQHHRAQLQSVRNQISGLRVAFTAREAELTRGIANWRLTQQRALVQSQVDSARLLSAEMRQIEAMGQFRSYFNLIKSRFLIELEHHNYAQARVYFDAYTFMRERIVTYFGSHTLGSLSAEEHTRLTSFLKEGQTQMLSMYQVVHAPQTPQLNRVAQKASDGDDAATGGDVDSPGRETNSPEIPDPSPNFEVPGHEPNSCTRDRTIRIGDAEFNIHDSEANSDKQVFEAQERPSPNAVNSELRIELVFDEDGRSSGIRHEPITPAAEIPNRIHQKVEVTVHNTLGNLRPDTTLPRRENPSQATTDNSPLRVETERLKDLVCYSMERIPRDAARRELEVLRGTIEHFARTQDYYNHMLDSSIANFLGTVQESAAHWMSVSTAIGNLPTNIAALALSPGEYQSYLEDITLLRQGVVLDIVNMASGLHPAAGIPTAVFQYSYAMLCGTTVLGEPVSQREAVILAANVAFSMVPSIFPDAVLPNLIAGQAVEPAIRILGRKAVH